MDDGARLRIERRTDKWYVIGSDIVFNETELMAELASHSERFSPNVILRGSFPGNNPAQYCLYRRRRRAGLLVRAEGHL